MFPNTKGSLESWYAEVKDAEWKTPHDIKENYSNVKILRNKRAVFKILGNQYRLIVAINYDRQIVQIRFIGDHKTYDKINAKEI